MCQLVISIKELGFWINSRDESAKTLTNNQEVGRIKSMCALCIEAANVSQRYIAGMELSVTDNVRAPQQCGTLQKGDSSSSHGDVRVVRVGLVPTYHLSSCCRGFPCQWNGVARWMLDDPD